MDYASRPGSGEKAANVALGKTQRFVWLLAINSNLLVICEIGGNLVHVCQSGTGQFCRGLGPSFQITDRSGLVLGSTYIKSIWHDF